MTDHTSSQFGISLRQQELKAPTLDARGVTSSPPSSFRLDQPRTDVRSILYSRPNSIDRGLAQKPLTLRGDQLESYKTQKAPKSNALFINPSSSLSAARLASMIRNSAALPPNFRQYVRVGPGAGSIEFPRTAVASPGRDWMHDLGELGDQWELTTATLVIELGSNGAVMGQLLDERLQSGDFNTHAQEERGDLIITRTGTGKNEKQQEIIRRRAYDLDNLEENAANKLLMIGKTIPNKDMARRDARGRLEVARLQSKRNLIVVASDVIVQMNNRRVRLSPVTIPNRLVVNKVIHELSAHAGRISQGLTAEHGISHETQRNEEQIDAMFQPDLLEDLRRLKADIDNRIALTIRAVSK